MLGIIVLQARPDRTQNRALAALLIFEGCAAFGGSGLLYLTTRPDVAYASQIVAFTFAGAALFAYPLFLGTLATPLTRPFSSRTARRLLVGAMVAAPLFVLSGPHRFVLGMKVAPYATWEAVVGPLGGVLFLGAIAFALWGLVVALHMWLRAPPGTMRRRQGRLYALAFAVRDGGILWFMGVQTVAGGSAAAQLVAVYLITAAMAVFVLLLAYALLKAQLLEIDLKIKWSVRRGSVGLAMVVAFFVASEGTELLVSERFGTAAGLLAAVYLALAARPLQRAAARLSDLLMPDVQDTASYRKERRNEVFLAALEGARHDGTVTDAEERILTHLARHLGIDDTERAALVAAAETGLDAGTADTVPTRSTRAGSRPRGTAPRRT